MSNHRCSTHTHGVSHSLALILNEYWTSYYSTLLKLIMTSLDGFRKIKQKQRPERHRARAAEASSAESERAEREGSGGGGQRAPLT